MLKKLYPVVDRLTKNDRVALGLKLADFSLKNVHGARTGHFRCPKAGEWFLSGTPAKCYRAPNDLNTEYHIVRLFRTETKKITTICRIY